MTDRIQFILKSMNLSPSQFADEISVQRSSLSHILSGRNKPSLDFVSKVLTSYPDISSDWLLFGTGTMMRKAKKERSEPIGEVITETSPSAPAPGPTLKKTAKESQVTEEKERKEPQEVVSKPKTDKDLERIIFLYTDKTFKTYTQAE